MTIDPPIIGGIACGDPIEQQEASYFEALAEVTSYQIQGDKLMLSGPTVTLIFTAGPQPR
jgi:heat shock protein HslJ